MNKSFFEAHDWNDTSGMHHAHKILTLHLGLKTAARFYMICPFLFTSPVSSEVSALIRVRNYLHPCFNRPQTDKCVEIPMETDISTLFSVSNVLVQVAVRAASVAVLCSIGASFPRLLWFVISCAVRAAQVPAFSLTIVYSLPYWSLAPLICSLQVVIMPQVLQV